MSFGNNKPHSQKCSANFVNELQEKDFVVVETVFCKAGGFGAIIVFHFHKSRLCVCADELNGRLDVLCIGTSLGRV